MKYSFRLTDDEDKKFKDIIKRAQDLNLLSNYTITSIIRAGLISFERNITSIEKKRSDELLVKKQHYIHKNDN